MRSFVILAALLLSCSAWADDKPGHSKHGSAFDSGMRTRPWEMKGIGKAPFATSSTNPEFKKWFDQGNALLHSFWFEEAERSFRWCLKLEPNSAMAYWSLARCGFNWFTIGAPDFTDKFFDRSRAFLAAAVLRKGSVSERERMYIEAWERAFASGMIQDRAQIMCRALQEIVIRYPDDIEAKCLLALFSIGRGSAYSNQLLIDQVLRKSPMHPGAHHVSIHNWDGVSSEQAIRSCELYVKAAPEIGHALHMPGHIYSKIGMWHEAAIAMDSAARTELRYMNERLALPFETWNYPHNRNYLCYIQEQLGMAEASLQGAKDLIAAPTDPDINPADYGALSGQGRAAMNRALVKFERWEQIMDAKAMAWPDGTPDGKLERNFMEALALNGLGRTAEAREKVKFVRTLTAIMKGGKDEASPFDAMLQIADGLVSYSEGKPKEGEKLLQAAVDDEQKQRRGEAYPNDPPFQSWPIARLLADEHRKLGENQKAIKMYELALRNEPNDGFTLSGLTLSHFALGNRSEATEYAGRLMHVWSQADPNLKWMEAVKKLNLPARPIAKTPRPERTYQPRKLDPLGPMNWQPFGTPNLQVRDRDGRQVRLSDYKGKNVLLVFFLGSACVHCVDQLRVINEKGAEFEAQDTAILAVCSQTPASMREAANLDQAKVRFLSDTSHENARRFSSYDDFEEMELHSTILIDKAGRIHWKRTGGDPFMNIDFLLKELKRINGR